jgi:hypothetical protein
MDNKTINIATASVIELVKYRFLFEADIENFKRQLAMVNAELAARVKAEEGKSNGIKSDMELTTV